MTISLEHKWPILIQHAHHTRTSRPTIKPPVDRVAVGIALGLEKYVVVAAGIELQVALG